MIYEVQVAGTTVQMDNLYACENAFKNSHGDAVIYERTANGVKVVKAKRAKGFSIKDIAKFKN